MSYWVLRNFVWKFPGDEAFDTDKVDPEEEVYLVVPEGGDGTKTRVAELYAYAFNLHVDPRFQHCDIDQMPHGFQRLTDRLKLASGGATSFSLYPIIDQETYELMEAEKRLAALALWPDAVNTEDYGNIDDAAWRDRQTVGRRQTQKIVRFNSYRSPTPN